MKMIKEEKYERKIDVATLKAVMCVRYWEDATVNGVEDKDGNLIPLRNSDSWCIAIDVDTGIIRDWPKGVIADVHYKVCGAGAYHLYEFDGTPIAELEGYVPEIMCPEKNGYGDYVIMKIDGAGKIQNWKCTPRLLLEIMGQSSDEDE